jgi:hypothetical protein
MLNYDRGLVENGVRRQPLKQTERPASPFPIEKVYLKKKIHCTAVVLNTEPPTGS